MKPRKVSGFTKIELVFTIACLFVLLALLLPSLGHRSHGGRKTQCANNVRHIGLAAIQYEMRRGEFPGYMMHFGDYSPTAVKPDPLIVGTPPPAHAKIGAWAVALLSDLDNQPVYEFWTVDRYALMGTDPMYLTADGYDQRKVPNMEIFQCPDDASDVNEAFGRNSYASNNGTFAATLPSHLQAMNSESPANGIFNLKVEPSEVVGGSGSWTSGAVKGSRVCMEDIRDGKGQTLLFAENSQAEPWYRVVDHASDLVPETLHRTCDPLVAEALTGLLWHYADDEMAAGSPKPDRLFRINGGDLLKEKITDGPTPQHRARPSSFHTGGVNAIFADGGMRFISDKIDYRVYQALMTPWGEQSNVPDPTFKISDGDL
ncbi:DUF1559 domain-containing protein [Rosistilla oblonga]|uniref:DUF1559 family PulG-like putative transporter n=1 Tax=Rosistilla oblonga TaxID=2527990 RepID=UPI003A9700B8